MIERVQAKRDAKDQLRGNWGRVIGAFFLMEIIVGVANLTNLIPYVGFIFPILLGGVWSLGYCIYSLKFVNGEEVKFSDMFSGFEKFGKAVAAYLLVGIFTLLWSLLFIIPGIIKAYSYSMTFYVLADQPELSAKEALDRSKAITQGHKWQLFVTYLSFIGWILLSILTLGIGLLWVVPYMQMTIANIYNQIKDNY